MMAHERCIVQYVHYMYSTVVSYQSAMSFDHSKVLNHVIHSEIPGINKWFQLGTLIVFLWF